MTSEIEGLDALAEDVDQLEQALGDVSGMTSTFTTQLQAMRGALGQTNNDLAGLQRGFSGGLRRAFDGLILDGRSLSDTLSSLSRSMIDTAYSAALRPITNQIGGIMSQGFNALVAGMSPFAQGAPFSQGRVMPFAKGGVLSGPVSFPMRGGTGLMGEAGPEAIMPLTRGADGRLGVQAQGGGTIHVTMNVTTPDVAGFQRSQSQIAAQMARALGRGQRNR
ncbi:phage tail tape measure protein [Ponticoccus sp. SC2-23]|uniref:phage tail tape measure protein n=1 Tax=Alexandriicola marinus TaxID=2081710 RepID=UPI000FDCD1C7|nr:phage tail tape measure protein [Alexandriicola marinus]MBM1222564.1 phage tail tape measure protein [Ponticoccus sp. SC6-9]MBM1227069.1 phage tail tape measure protein [Ponticoccus sp. SC6-15]MBM1231490.1 phage tail tape measure protein [Ponticoccus sp. SC6-38]MBM1236074.1 phage tail tape measure protein [Ponticoccus sp. SC6-45]MBM1240513.1 phage tail tape measure protein [Ponticoccus sp. SC6-49]MBM1245048.1 phage tail tape measure protein [Ponticoccus sp. SC2-64]MBM1249548.1 phage tail 